MSDPKKMGVCRFCGQHGKLVDAHVIPKSFYVAGPKKIASNAPNEHPKKSRIGAYDRGIICEGCEPMFDRPDSYAAELLLQGQESFIRVMSAGQLVGYQVNSFDYPLLKLFFMGVLWRAAVSSHDLFRGVQIGRYEDRLRSMLASRDPGSPDDFSVILSLYDDRPAAGLILSPMRARLGSVNAYQFTMGRYSADIKVDKQRLAADLRLRQVSDSQPLRILHQQFAGSETQALAVNLVRDLEARRKTPLFHY